MRITNSRAALRLGIVLVLSCFSCTAVFAQQAAVPTVRFTLDFPASNPSHYEISIHSDGHGSYSSKTKPEADSDASADSSSASDAAELYQADFAASPSTAAHIFDLARQAHYFAGKIDSSKKNMAFTGDKTLTYDAPGQSTHAAYMYSSIPAVQQITAAFQDLSAALEFGRRLDHDLHYQKTALEAELSRMEDMASSGQLPEFAVASSVLQKIADDPSIMNVSRSRAQKLLAKATSQK